MWLPITEPYSIYFDDSNVYKKCDSMTQSYLFLIFLDSNRVNETSQICFT